MKDAIIIAREKRREQRAAAARSKALDAEWEARARVVSIAAVIATCDKPEWVSQELLDELRVAWADYQQRQEERQELSASGKAP